MAVSSKLVAMRLQHGLETEVGFEYPVDANAQSTYRNSFEFSRAWQRSTSVASAGESRSARWLSRNCSDCACSSAPGGWPYANQKARSNCSACGFQSAAVGPFYCPLDEKVYIDLAFFQEMRDKLGAPGDFAQAYVIAHEVGHHVQKLLGISQQVHDAQQRASEREANELSVRLELQADFFAGVWAHHAERNWRILEPGDIEEALNAATAIGDDRLQMRGRGFVVPESFTHGSSSQRVRWFALGLKTGDVTAGDTFDVPYDRL